MVGQVYTRRIFGPAVLSLSTTSIYTVPAGTTTVLRTVSLVNNSGTVTSTIILGLGSTANGVRLLKQIMPPDTTVYLDVRIALHAGEVLWGYAAGAAGSATCSITAYVFDP